AAPVVNIFMRTFLEVPFPETKHGSSLHHCTPITHEICFRCNLLKLMIVLWWRRRESNPRPKMLLVKRLHAYSRSCPWHYPKTFATAAQNGQETVAASLRS